MQRPDELLPMLRVAWVAFMTAFALLSVLRAPIGALWKPAVGATEAGYLLVFLLIPAFVGGLRTNRDTLLFACGLAAAVLLISSALRARPIGAELPARLREAFGEPAQAPSAPAYSFAGLLRIKTAGPAPTTHTYPAVDGTDLRLDFYAPTQTTEPPPLVVVIHGGSWSGGDRTQLPAINAYLAARGFAVASIEYRLAPAHTYPAQPDDVRAAVDWLRERHETLGFDPDRLVLYGRSAGAHLALLAAYSWREPWVRAVVGLYAPADMHWSWQNPSNPLVLDTPTTLRAFLGGAPDDTPELRARYTEASPYHQVHQDAPPTLLIHGGRDELVNPRQSVRLAERLAEHGVPHVHLALPWATHGCEANLAGPSGQLTVFALEWLLATSTR